MFEPDIPLNPKDSLAVSIALGKSVCAWARENDVPKSTAYDWAHKPEVRRTVEEFRRRALDRVIGWLNGRSMRAVKTLTRLSESAESEAVQLRAVRAVLSDQLVIAKHANLNYRVSQLEENERARIGSADPQP